MKPFLYNVAEDILGNYGHNLPNCMVVLPSRRSVLFFRQYLSQQLHKPVWAPNIITMQDLVQQNCPYIVQEELNLVLLLYKVQQQLNAKEDLAKFYHWGKMLLKDFDDADRQLVDAKSLFTNLSAAKELEMWQPGEDVEEPGCVRQFWTSFGNEPRSKMQAEFNALWANAEKLHKYFSLELQQRNWAYEGMAYRYLANKVAEGWKPGVDKLFFVGFNALSRAEEKIMLTLQKAGVAELYIDADKYYIDDEGMDAGENIRKLLQKTGQQEPKWISDSLASDKKEITFAGATGDAGQAKALSAELQALAESGPVQWENTAVVLPNEALLFPVLYSLPQQVPHLNITMGYPLKNTPLYSFVQDVQRLQESVANSGEAVSFYHKFVTKVLAHPYAAHLEEKKNLDALYGRVKQDQVVRVKQEQVFNLLKAEEMRQIFVPFSGPEEVTKLLLNVSQKLFEIYADERMHTGNPEAEFFAAFSNLLRQMHTSLQELPGQITMTAFWKILNAAMQGTSVPFSGEPLRGLQIMGMLESRTLDFENIFILSANEGTLPSFSFHGSFIPFDLRKGFGLPTYQEQTAIYSYHFYRAIQRAKKVCIIYNNKIDNFSKGEKSRYLLQIENLLAPKSNLSLIKKTYSAKAAFADVSEISLQKSDSIVQALLKIGTQSGFSASALITYMLCPLKFYLQRILNITEPEEVEEELSGSSFGTIYHDAIEYLYNGKKQIAKEDILELEAKIDEALEFAASESKINLAEALKGRNFFLLETIKILLKKTLQKDLDLVPFQINGLEEDLRCELEVAGFGSIKLRGLIDRVDSTADGLRIVDYKTGNLDVLVYDFDTELPEVSIRNKEAFQAVFYCYLYFKEKGSYNLRPQILPLKKINDGYQSLKGNSVITEEHLQKFELQLSNLFKEMFGLQSGFKQTEDTKYCSYCAYKKMCNRN